jgi:hypothetical protein
MGTFFSMKMLPAFSRSIPLTSGNDVSGVLIQRRFLAVSCCCMPVSRGTHIVILKWLDEHHQTTLQWLIADEMDDEKIRECIEINPKGYHLFILTFQ